MINFDEDIICFVIYNGNYYWYVAYKELWFLDLDSYDQAWQKKGYEIQPWWTSDERKNTRVLSKENAQDFLSQIKDARFTTEELRDLLIKERSEAEGEDYWYYLLSPSLLIDFDNQVLYNCNYEISAYENYVPTGWRGIYDQFRDLVPIEYRYWIDKSGVDLFQKFIEEN